MKISEMAKAIEADLTRYANTTQNDMRRIIRREADNIADEVRTVGDYQDRTGKYRKSIKVRMENVGMTAVQAVVYSDKHYQLTHLLENGHVNRDGSRTRSYPHWINGQRMAEEIVEKMQKELGK